MVTVRDMTESDTDAVCGISEACYHYAVSVQDFTEQQVNVGLKEHCGRDHVSSLRLNGIASVAESEGSVIGVIATRENTIQALFVKPSVHRKGAGRALFHRAEEAMSKAGYSTITVKTTPSAIPFYMSMGMKRVGSWTPKGGPFSGREFTVLEKRLKPQPAASPRGPLCGRG